MRDSIERIRRDGYSEVLLKWAKKWRAEKLGKDTANAGNGCISFTMLPFNGLCRYHRGIVEKSASVIAEISLCKEIEVDIQSRELLRVNRMDLSGIEHARVLDLSDDGERWEGDVLQNKPFGWGVLYDKDGEKVYEGFRIGDVNVCYGRSYYPDVQKVEYEGEIYKGKRWGRGVQYDRNGNTVFDGEWMDDEQIEKSMVLNEENQLFHNHIEELIISDGCCNGRECKVFDISFFIKLRRLIIGNGCFKKVETVRLIGLSQLERVVVGDCCFKKDYHCLYYDRHCCFYLKNCPQLKELKMGCYSFSDYSVCEIENVPSLEVIEMGRLNYYSYNFFYASLELKSDCERMK